MKLSIQYSHHEHDEFEDKTINDLAEALSFFEQFDWPGEANKASVLQKGYPTMSLVLNEEKEYISISAYEEFNNIYFLSECHFPGEVPSWFGLSKKQGIVGLSTQFAQKQQARDAIDYFINQQYDALRDLYKSQAF